MELLKKLKLSELSERDYIAVVGGTALVGVIVLYSVLSHFLFSPLKMELLTYEKNTVKLRELDKIKNEFLVENKRFGEFRSKLPQPRADMNALVMDVARRAGLDKKVENVKPVTRKIDDFKEVTIKFSLTSINTKELVDFLFQIRNNPKFLHISEMNITPQTAEESSFLDVQFKILTYTEGE